VRRRSLINGGDASRLTPHASPLGNLYLITDRRRLPAGRTLIDTVEAALTAGAPMVQLREKDLPARELFVLAQELRRLTRRHGALLLINDRIDVALAVEADGVHLGGHSLPVAVARQLLGPKPLLAVSTHHRAEIHAAAAAGADFVTFGPVYATPSKAPFGPPQGVEKLRAACAGAPLPVFALGGMTAARRLEVLAAGASGIACIAAVLGDPDPAGAVRALLTPL
jgi:thiamine-phosphate pyrophosphorylase